MFLNSDTYRKDFEYLFKKGCFPMLVDYDFSINIERLSGLTNHVYKITINDKKSPLIYHEFSNNMKYFIDHSKENFTLNSLVLNGLYGEVFYADNERRIEEYYPGLPIKLDDLRDFKMIKGLFYQLTYIHSRINENMEDVPMIDNLINKPEFFNMIYKEIEERILSYSEIQKKQKTGFDESKMKTLRNLFQDVFTSKTQNKLKDFLKEIKEIPLNLNIPKDFYYCFCHNDLNNTNILIKDNKDPLSIRLIDYEYGSLNYLVYEFANYFGELAINYNYENPPYFQFDPLSYPDKTLRTKIFLIYCYYHKLWSLQVKNTIYSDSLYSDATPSEDDLKEIYKDYDNVIKGLEMGTNYARVFSHYFWLIIAGLSLNMSDLGIDLYEYILMRYEFMNKILSKQI